jgi:GNAT superfamily N-acetyltransferase
VKRRYRRKGLGASLLEEAVSVCRTKHWDGPVFADSHATSARLLLRMFTLDFDQMERRARSMLDKVANQYRAEQV